MVHWNEKKARKITLAKVLAIFALSVVVIAISERLGTARGTDSDTLQRIARIDLGVPELSGIALRPLPGTRSEVEVVGIGDRGGELARLPLSVTHPENLAGRVPHVVDLGPMLLATLTLCDPRAPERCPPAMRQAAAQWEALAADATGRLFALQESHDVIIGLSPNADRVEVVLHLDYGLTGLTEKKPSKHGKRRNSRGEGLLLLKNGHVLVALESKPAVIVELGPEGDSPRGFSPSQLLSPGEAFTWFGVETPGGTVARGRLVALGRWRLADDRRGCDAADLAVDESGRLLVLSQSCAAITAYDSLPVGDGRAIAARRLELPRRLRRAEALAVLPGGRFLVGEDFKAPRRSLHVLELPSLPADFATLAERLLPSI